MEVSSAPDPQRSHHLPSLKLWYGLGCFGFLLRVVLWKISEGTNDIRTWARFAIEIGSYGLGGTYVHDVLFNHPPWMGLLSRAVYALSLQLNVPFHHAFKLLGMFAEVGTALLLRQLWLRRGQPERAAQAFAAYGCGLCGILISGYHGNTDPAYWFLVLAAVYLLHEHEAPLLAGLTLGAALNIKLIPLFVVLPLAATCKSWRALVRFALGGLIMFGLFVAPMLSFDAVQRAAFARNVLGYTSYRENWGIELVLRAVVEAFRISAPAIARNVDELGALYARTGSMILLAVTTALAGYELITRHKHDAYAVAAMCFGLFLVLASGFGVQYLGAVVPLLLALRIRDGFLYASMSGVFIGLLYCSFVRTWTPIFSQHNYFSAAFAAPAFATWWLLIVYTLRVWRMRDHRSGASTQ